MEGVAPPDPRRPTVPESPKPRNGRGSDGYDSLLRLGIERFGARENHPRNKPAWPRELNELSLIQLTPIPTRYAGRRLASSKTVPLAMTKVAATGTRPRRRELLHAIHAIPASKMAHAAPI